MTTLTIDLPDSLAKEAQDAGLLVPTVMEAMIREHLRQRAVKGLFNAADQLSNANFTPMTMDEIQAEVNTVRTQRQ